MSEAITVATRPAQPVRTRIRPLAVRLPVDDLLVRIGVELEAAQR